VITKYFRFFFLQQMWGKRMCRPIRFIAAGWSGSMRVQLLFSQSGQLSWEHWVNKRGSGNRQTHTHTHLRLQEHPLVHQGHLIKASPACSQYEHSE